MTRTTPHASRLRKVAAGLASAAAMYLVIAAVLEVRNESVPLVAITGAIVFVGLIAIDSVRSIQGMRRRDGMVVPTATATIVTSATAIGCASLMLVVISVYAEEYDEVFALGLFGCSGAIMTMIGLRLWLGPVGSSVGRLVRVAGTIALAGMIVVALIVTFQVVSDGLLYRGSWYDESMLFFPATVVLFAAATCVIIFELRLFAASRQPDIQETWSAMDPVDTDCPSCRHRFSARHGTMRCPACRVVFFLRFEEERCVCNQLLYRLPGSTCPECGRPRRGTPENTASEIERIAQTNAGVGEDNASRGEQ